MGARKPPMMTGFQAEENLTGRAPKKCAKNSGRYQLPAHRHSQKSILDIYGIGGQEQVEHTAFSPIAGHLDVLEAIFT